MESATSSPCGYQQYMLRLRAGGIDLKRTGQWLVLWFWHREVGYVIHAAKPIVRHARVVLSGSSGGVRVCVLRFIQSIRL